MAFGFNDNEFISYSQTNAGKRNFRLQDNMKSYNESLQNEKLMKQQKFEAEKQNHLNESAKNSVNFHSISMRHRRQEDIKLEKQLFDKVLTRYITEMVISSLVFDDDFIHSEKNLSENINNVIDKMFSEGVLSSNSFLESENILMESAYFELQEVTKEFIRKRDTINIFSEDVIDIILTEARKSKDLSDEVAENVKKKVKDTIKTEKKVSKKKEQEKEDEEKMDEVADAADSLDDTEDTDEGMETESEPEEDDSSDEDDMSDDELDGMENDLDNDDVEDDPEDNEVSDEEMASDDNLDSEDDSELDAAADDDSMDGEDVDTDVDASANPEAGTMKITIQTDGKQVSVNANQSESNLGFKSLFESKMKYKERNSKSLFRNLLEGNIMSFSSKLNESGNSISMDRILAETVTEYTLLETLFTSKLLNLSNSQIYSIMRTLNFKRK